MIIVNFKKDECEVLGLHFCLRTEQEIINSPLQQEVALVDLTIYGVHSRNVI